MLEIYNNNDQQFNWHDFLIKFSLIICNIDFVMTTYILIFMCIKLNSLFDSEMKVFYVAQV